MNVADLKNPETGKTYREENNELQHKYNVDDLVEIKKENVDDDSPYAGIRLYIIGCVRDCDGTPLYVLGKKGESLYRKPGFYSYSSFSGFGESSLVLISSADRMGGSDS